MKRFLILLSLLFCNTVWADTINLHWLNEDGSTYQNSTCVIDSDLILPATPPTKYGYTFTGWKFASYIPIEYLESTGTQYIDTGVVGNINTEYEITAKNNQSVSSGTYAIFGSRTSASENSIMSAFNIDNGTYIMINDFGDHIITRQWPTISATDILHRYKLTNSKSKRTITDLDTGWTNTVTTTYSGSLTTPTNLYIGYSGSLGGWAYFENLQGRIYSCKIWDNDTLVRDFIPVLDYNGIPCMYDKVTGQFFYNAGTGDFIAGPTL